MADPNPLPEQHVRVTRIISPLVCLLFALSACSQATTAQPIQPAGTTAPTQSVKAARQGNLLMYGKAFTIPLTANSAMSWDSPALRIDEGTVVGAVQFTYEIKGNAELVDETAVPVELDDGTMIMHVEFTVKDADAGAVMHVLEASAHVIPAKDLQK